MQRLWLSLALALVVLLSACAPASPAATSTPLPASAPAAQTKPMATPTAGTVAAQNPTPAPTATTAPAPVPTQPAPAVTELTGKIGVAGSTTVQPLAEVLGAAFQEKHSKVQIEVQGGGSGVGVKSAGQGTADIGMVSREVRDSELQEFPDLKVHTIAIDGIAIAVNPGVGVSNLTPDQVKDIFNGTITNWKDVGGADKRILVVSREEGSGTRDAFQELIMGKDLILAQAILQPSNGAVRTTVATTPDSIAYLSFGYLDPSVKTLAMDGVEATEANAASGKYPVVRPLVMATKGDPKDLTKAWLDFILGSDGQDLVAKENYIRVK